MISRDFTGFTLVCDACDEEADETFDEFHGAVEFKKENGWKSRKTPEGWEDLCPECARKERGAR